jgi:hypothetical protein
VKRVLLRNILARILRGVAYVSTLLQWAWISILLLPPLIASGMLDVLFAPKNSEKFVQINPIEPSPLVWLFVCVVTAAILILTVFVFIRLPRTIARSGEKIVHQTSEAIIPTLTHHKTLPAKKRRELSRRLMLVIQLTASLLALLITLFTPQYEEITRQIVITLGLLLAGVSLSCFFAAWLIEPQKKARATSRTR